MIHWLILTVRRLMVRACRHPPEEGGVHVAFQPSDPFTTEELGSAGVCVASPSTVRADLSKLGAAVLDAIRQLDERRREGAS